MFQFKRTTAAVALFGMICPAASAFGLPKFATRSTTHLGMALDAAMESRLDGIRRSYRAMTERLGDPDVLADSNLLRQVMSDRSQSEEAVMAYEEYMTFKGELEGAKELFQEAGDDVEMREMARSEMKEIEPKMDALEKLITVLLLPKDPNDSRNVMLEIRAGTGGSEANIFAGECVLENITSFTDFVCAMMSIIISLLYSRTFKVICWTCIKNTFETKDGNVAPLSPVRERMVVTSLSLWKYKEIWSIAN